MLNWERVPGRRSRAEKVGGIEFVFVRGGGFQMGDLWGDGDDNERPVHEVEVSDFWMSRYLVTFDQYDAFCEAAGREKPSDSGWGRGRRPVIWAGWHDAVEFCNWRSERLGFRPCYDIERGEQERLVRCDFGTDGFRLPTEAEWEYAARSGGKEEKWAGMSDEARLAAYAWYSVNSGRKTHPVGGRKPNGLGLYDMSGNVLEWCWDWYGEDYYRSSPLKDPQGPCSGKVRVLRGGGWHEAPWRCRTVQRHGFDPEVFRSFVGFRVVRVARIPPPVRGRP